MFEAVGREYWRGYFQTLRDCLKPGGLACIQTITLREDLFARYLRSTDFIQQYIFPGGCCPAFPPSSRKHGVPAWWSSASGLRPRLCGNAAPLAPVLRAPARRRALPGL
jgi:hypothetical protein